MRHPLFRTRSFLESHAFLSPPSRLPAVTAHSKVALITGATGFIGGYLLIELLRQEAFDTCYCIVRGESEAIRVGKLKKALEEKGLNYERHKSRIVVLKGDISCLRLGLSLYAFRALAEAVDHVFHFAGTMNWVSSFGEETLMNIAALREVIRFSTAQKTKYLHYASSMGAWSLLRQDVDIIREDELHQKPDLLPGGYCQLKWVNEKICRIAMERGVPLSVYRIGDVKGHSQTGHSDPKNFGNLMMQQMMTEGIFPNRATQFNFLPVDYLTQAIACIALNAEQRPSQTYQFSNPELICLEEIAGVMAAAGLPMRAVSPDEWLASVDRNTLPRRAMRAVFKPFIPETGKAPLSFFDIGTELYRLKHCTQTTDQALEGHAIHCPGMLRDGVLQVYLQALRKQLCQRQAKIK